MKPYLAAAIQMTSSPNLGENLRHAEKLVEEAVKSGAILVGLPENFSFMGDETEKVKQASAIAAASRTFLTTMAQRHNITILGGGFPVAVEAERVANTALLISPDGDELSCYRKIHLFDVNLPDGNTYQESKTVLAGQDLPAVYPSETLGNLGLSVCYDVRFPELYRHLSKAGAQVLFVPAAFTAYTGKDHWRVLLQARAIENTCYVVAPAQTGFHYARRQTHGHAMIVDPWGVVLADAGEAPGMAIATIDPARISQVRQQMPALQHRVFA